MFLYGTRFGENPTFAPNYDDVVAQEKSQADAAAALWNAGRDAQIYRNNLQAHDWSTAEAYERRNKAIFEATGVQLENPFRASPEELARSTRERRFSGSQGFKHWRDRLENEWRQKVSELARERPQFADIIQPDRPIGEDAFQVTRDTETAESAAAAQADRAGLSLPSRFLNSLGGNFAGMLRDPVQVATLFVGGGISSPARFIGTRLLESFLTEAAINGGVEAAVQLGSNEWKKEAGVDASASAGLKQVGLAALFGGAFGGLLQGGREVFRALGRQVPEAELTRAAAGEAEPGDMATIADALGVKLDPETARSADLAAEQPALDRAAFGEPPASLDPAEAERLAAQAVRAAESPEDIRAATIDRVVQEQFPIGPPPKKPVTLMQFLTGRSIGGIRDESGELAAMGLSRKFVPGGGALVREKGKTLDMAREAAAEAGYFDHIYGDPERATALSTPDDLLRLLRQEAGGEPALSARNDGGRQFEWMDYERSQKAQEAYRRLLEDVDGAAARLELGEVRDSVLVRAAELVDDETDHMAALEKALDEDYRLQNEGDIDLGEPADAELEIPFFEDRQDAGTVHPAGGAPGEARADGELSGERGALATDGERLSGFGGDEAPQVGQRLRQSGETPEPATAEAGEIAELALVEARGPDVNITNTTEEARAFADPIDVAIAAASDQGSVYDRLDALRTSVRKIEKALAKKYGVRNVDQLEDMPLTQQERHFLYYEPLPLSREEIESLVDMIQPVADLNDLTSELGYAARKLPENMDFETMTDAERAAVGRVMFLGSEAERLGAKRDAVIEETLRKYFARFSDQNDGADMTRILADRIANMVGSSAPERRSTPMAITGTATEKTAAGEQTLLEGVKPVSTKERLEAQGARPMRGGDTAPPEGGLFDLDAQKQIDIWDAMPAARNADGTTLHATHATMIADADRSEFFGDLIAACKD